MNLQQASNDVPLESERQRRRSSLKFGEASLAVQRELPQSGASPPAFAPKGVRQPKWCLCFRMDRPPPKDRSTTELAWKHQRDFFITVIDPPSSMMSQNPVPYFASETACQIANIIVSRPFLEHLPGQSFERKSVAAVGPQCVTAGFVSAMLGAKVAFLAERRNLQYVQQNVKSFLKDTLDYTKLKNTNVTTICTDKLENLSSESICDSLNAAPPLDIVIISESGAEACSRMSGNDADPVAKLFQLLEELVPPKACSRVLLICDVYMCFDDTRVAHAEEHIGPIAKDERLPIEEELPLSWHVKPFCTMLRRFPVVWLERVDADIARRQKPLTPLRRYLPPMGAASARCGCGGHPQRNFLNHRVMNFEWQDNHQRLKESLVFHNRWKYTENAKELDKAKAWAASGCGVFLNSAFLEKAESSAFSDVGTSSSLDRTNGFSTSNSITASGDIMTLVADDMTNVDLQNEESTNLDSSEGMSGTRPPLSPPKSARSGRLARGRIGRLANKVAKTSTIVQRHAQPPHWYRCNRVPY